MFDLSRINRFATIANYRHTGIEELQAESSPIRSLLEPNGEHPTMNKPHKLDAAAQALDDAWMLAVAAFACIFLAAISIEMTAFVALFIGCAAFATAAALFFLARCAFLRISHKLEAGKSDAQARADGVQL
jgi:hypothetical protein